MGKTANDDQKRIISVETHSGSGGSLEGSVKPRRKLITGFGVVMLAVLAVAIFMLFNFHTVVVKGRSMFPTFHTNSKVLTCSAYWLVGPVKDGDVVVLKDPNPDGYIIKRVYKMGGETVDWKYAPDGYRLANGPYVVPAGDVFVLGDNRPESEDSRRFGPRGAETILGKVLVKP
jgi:signal peptidase I